MMESRGRGKWWDITQMGKRNLNYATGKDSVKASRTGGRRKAGLVTSAPIPPTNYRVPGFNGTNWETRNRNRSIGRVRKSTGEAGGPMASYILRSNLRPISKNTGRYGMNRVRQPRKPGNQPILL
jgi:hypothetical protein